MGLIVETRRLHFEVEVKTPDVVDPEAEVVDLEADTEVDQQERIVGFRA